MAREVRVSPDGHAVAIRSNAAVDAWNAWGVMHALYGGHWTDGSDLEAWTVLVPDETGGS